jgi:hypothetical protein
MWSARSNATQDSAALAAARALLDVREGATVGEVTTAYRAAIKAARPDLGRTDSSWVPRMQAARDLLLQAAKPDRRRTRRAEKSLREVLPRRRSTWAQQPPTAPSMKLDL